MSHSKIPDKKTTLFLSLAALGIVYGDIGTSPLYAINEIFFGHGKATLSRLDVLGAISLVVWSLTLLIAFKYVVFVLKADNKGEGGVFALYSLIEKIRSKSKVILSVLLIIAAGLLFGDGIITPAISVISSIEGLTVATNTFSPYVVPLTIIILTGLFAIQSKGTSKVGSLFGPIVIVWFASIFFFGTVSILHTPQIFLSINPYYAFYFLLHHTFLDVLLTLGAVMLVITGGEAMYADMGHFGALPIRLSWFSIVFPSLLINYFGQGAYLLSGNAVINGNIFFSMIPSVMIYPMVIISTLATIIASQALISGGFSLASQAISLKLFPFFKVTHTHHKHEGQIYVPFINWALYVGCVSLVVIFQSSNRLASAYGLAVSGVMLVTSLSMIQVAVHYWKWKPALAYAVFVPLIIIDASFMISNSLKIIEGGYIPLGIGLGILFIMQTWKWGREKIAKAFNEYPATSLQDLIKLKKSEKYFIPRTIMIMTPKAIRSSKDTLPTLKQLFLDRYGILPENIIFLTVELVKEPILTSEERYIVTNLFQSKTKGTITSVVIRFGFMENPNVEGQLEELAHLKKLNISHNHNDWVFDIIQERTLKGHTHTLFAKLRYELFKFLSRNTDTADIYFGLGREKHLSAEMYPVEL